MKTFTDNQWQQIYNLLTLLARKKYPDIRIWATWEIDYQTVRCLICDEVVDITKDNKYVIIRNHGYQHLVSRNLLPFI